MQCIQRTPVRHNKTIRCSVTRYVRNKQRDFALEVSSLEQVRLRPRSHLLKERAPLFTFLTVICSLGLMIKASLSSSVSIRIVYSLGTDLQLLTSNLLLSSSESPRASSAASLLLFSSASVCVSCERACCTESYCCSVSASL